MENIEFSRNNVKNFQLIDKLDGILPIKGNHIGQILINKKEKTISIELKQCAESQIIDYFEGHLLCKNAEYKIINTNINGGVFILNNRNNSNKFELQINNNCRGIIINYSEIELIDYKEISKSIDEYRNIYISSLYGGYFEIINEKE